MNYGAVNYHWNHSNLKEGIETGYKGTIKAIEEYEKKQKIETRSSAKRERVINLLTPHKAMRAERWNLDDKRK